MLVGTPGFALRADQHAPESAEYLITEFAQLDAHNSEGTSLPDRQLRKSSYRPEMAEQVTSSVGFGPSIPGKLNHS
ncbi:hypothetical protein [Parazoarcus communis]|uniref:hypothetical protein n=1 Tax=Parazoarcus communis TaxID=41977 RepID=UPI00131F11AE|nr:hypothetical protein [Parazoarcus communis]